MHRTMSPIGGLCLAIVLIVACGKNTQRSEHTFKLELVEGIEVARTSGGPAFVEPPLSCQLLYEPKQDPEVPESLIGWADRVSVDEFGNLYVFDLQQSYIAVYESTGEFLRLIGRSGEGPGEFASINFLHTANGVLRTWDYQQRRLSVYSFEGELLDFHSLYQFGPGTLYADYNSSGILVVYRRETLPPQSEYDKARGHLLFIQEGGGTTAEYYTPPVHTRYLSDRQRGRWSQLPYSGPPVFAVTPDGHYLFGTGDEPILSKYDQHGHQVGRIEIDLDHEPVSDDEHRAILDEYEARLASAEGSARDI